MRARILSGLFLLAALAAPALAAGRPMAGEPSLDRVLPEIRRHMPGHFYNAIGPFVGPDGGVRYRVKWMTPTGQIIWFDADAYTGRVLGPAPPGLTPADRFNNHFRNWPGGFGSPYGPPPGYDYGRPGHGRGSGNREPRPHPSPPLHRGGRGGGGNERD